LGSLCIESNVVVKKRERLLPAVWFRREDYDRIRLIVDDPDNFPDSFDQWLDLANRQLAHWLRAPNVRIEKVIIDPDGFAAFCAQTEIEADACARVGYATALLDRKYSRF
jgi:hypothetical protein